MAQQSRKVFKHTASVVLKLCQNAADFQKERVLTICLNFLYILKAINDVLFPSGNRIKPLMNIEKI